MPITNDPSVFVRRTPKYGIDRCEFTADFATIADAAEANGFYEKTVRECCEGLLESIGGYHFEYVAGVPKHTGNHYVPNDYICVRRTGALLGNNPVDYSTVAEAAKANGFSTNDVEKCCAGYYRCVSGYHFELIVDEPDMPVTGIESMKTRKVRHVETGCVYNNCIDAAQDWRCEPCHIYEACAHPNTSVKGDDFEWVDDPVSSADDTESNSRDDYAECCWLW